MILLIVQIKNKFSSHLSVLKHKLTRLQEVGYFFWLKKAVRLRSCKILFARKNKVPVTVILKIQGKAAVQEYNQAIQDKVLDLLLLLDSNHLKTVIMRKIKFKKTKYSNLLKIDIYLAKHHPKNQLINFQIMQYRLGIHFQMQDCNLVCKIAQ